MTQQSNSVPGLRWLNSPSMLQKRLNPTTAVHSVKKDIKVSDSKVHSFSFIVGIVIDDGVPTSVNQGVVSAGQVTGGGRKQADIRGASVSRGGGRVCGVTKKAPKTSCAYGLWLWLGVLLVSLGRVCGASREHSGEMASSGSEPQRKTLVQASATIGNNKCIYFRRCKNKF